MISKEEQERVEMLKKFIYEETHYTKDCNCILCDERRDLLKEIKKIWGLK